mmetsp:Transcript_7085/g.10824  ORF Transcript_7085/g.10824 Transcript_7085/m.10824 type:complete len:133 (-) Transcript_7085:791-1189(-)
MAGPFGRIVAQLVVMGVGILARALPAAYGAALRNAQKGGGEAAKSGATVFGKRMAKSEALGVLNLTEQECTVEAIQRQYDRYFAANAVEKGGSFYLQSKVYRAKEMLDDFIKEKRMEEQQQTQQEEKSSEKK